MNADEHWMRQALNLAAQGEGNVEPNPMVGCVLVFGDQCIGQGYHTGFGRAHAEVEAIADANRRGNPTAGATAYVTLEPCSHHGKTPPCSQALLDARVARVVVSLEDPFPQVAGQGIAQLRNAGIQVDVGTLAGESRWLLAPYLKRTTRGLPWLLGKWAMTLDGKIATSTGDSRWVSGEGARKWVHQTRARMDGILVGIGTALADDPLLTVRPPGQRTPARLVLDRQLRLPAESRLVQSANQVPLIVAAGVESPPLKIQQLERMGVTVWQPSADGETRTDYAIWTRRFLEFLAQEGMTNVLVEGGAAVLGNLLDQQLIDEVAVFVAPKLVGGTGPGPIGGTGIPNMASSLALSRLSHQVIGPDVLIRGRMNYPSGDHQTR